MEYREILRDTFSLNTRKKLQIRTHLTQRKIGFIWSPSACECKCDKSCDFEEYINYMNHKCRKRLIDKLVENCDEDIDGNEMV